MGRNIFWCAEFKLIIPEIMYNISICFLKINNNIDIVAIEFSVMENIFSCKNVVDVDGKTLASDFEHDDVFASRSDLLEVLVLRHVFLFVWDIALLEPSPVAETDRPVVVDHPLILLGVLVEFFGQMVSSNSEVAHSI